MTESRHPWIAAAEAARILGVTRTTLYAYVSRGFIRSQALPGSTRERAYSREDVERLRRRTEGTPRPGQGGRSCAALGHADAGVAHHADRRPASVLPRHGRSGAGALAVAGGGRRIDLDGRLR